MNLTKIEIKVLKVLLSSSDYVTTYDIANATGINRRLIRDIMLDVKKKLNKDSVVLDSKPSKGYILDRKQGKAIQKLQTLVMSEEKKLDSIVPNEPGERQNYILTRIIEANDFVKVDTLAEELMVSRSTISNDLVQCRRRTEKYHLKYTHKPNYGIKIEGNEIYLRQHLFDNKFYTISNASLIYSYLDNYLYDPFSIEYTIIQILNRFEIKMNDIALFDLLICLLVAMRRILIGETIVEIPFDYEFIKDRDEYKAARKIAQFLSIKTEVVYNEYEVAFLAILILCKRSTDGMDYTITPQIIEMRDETIKEIKKETLISIDEISDDNSKEVILKYISSALMRQRFEEKIRTPLFMEVISKNPLSHELALITSNIFEKYTGKYLRSSEVASFTSLYDTILNLDETNKKKALFIGSLSGIQADLAVYRINHKFNNLFEIVDCYPYYKLESLDLSKYDFVISNMPIRKELPLPVISISFFITDDDLNTIEQYFNYNFHTKKMLYHFHPKLYVDHINYKQSSKIIDVYFNCVKALYPGINDTVVHMLKNKQYKNSIINSIEFIELNKPFNSNNSIGFVVLDEPVIRDNKNVQLIVILSAVENKNVIYNTIYNSLELFSMTDNFKEFINNPSYVKLIKNILNYSNI